MGVQKQTLSRSTGLFKSQQDALTSPLKAKETNEEELAHDPKQRLNRVHWSVSIFNPFSRCCFAAVNHHQNVQCPIIS